MPACSYPVWTSVGRPLGIPSPGPSLLFLSLVLSPPHPVSSRAGFGLLCRRQSEQTAKQRPPVQGGKPPRVCSARLWPERGQGRARLAHFHPGPVRGHCGRSRSGSRVERGETQLGAAPSTLGTAKTALCFLVREFPWFSWEPVRRKVGRPDSPA